MSTFKTIWTTEDRFVEVIDQRVLPHELVHVKLMNYRDADLAIRNMTVRGAPLIGATAAYGIYLAVRELIEEQRDGAFLDEAFDVLRASRPTAINLFWALDRMQRALDDADDRMYAICGFLGFSTGYWAIFNQMAAEQFGTNLRATAATTIPNMVRGALPLINSLFLDILQKSLGWSIIQSGIFTGAIVMGITLIAFVFTEETYHKDLDYLEHDNPLP